MERWSAAEDRVVRAAVMKYGTNQWSRVASLLLAKTAAQCRARWLDHLDPRIAARPWTRAEDCRLCELQRRMPNMWRSIGAALGGRTGEQCYARWQELRAPATSQMPRVEPVESAERRAESDAAAERQLLAEAEARLANSMGRKAKRKQRERREAELAFLDSVQRHRETGGAIAAGKRRAGAQAPPRTDAADAAEAALAATRGRGPPSRRDRDAASKPAVRRRPNRPRLRLPAARADEAAVASPVKCSREHTRAVLTRLAGLPEPRGRTLEDLYEPPAASEAAGSLSEELWREPPEVGLHMELARRLVRDELANTRASTRTGARDTAVAAAGGADAFAARGALGRDLVKALNRRRALFDSIRRL